MKLLKNFLQKHPAILSKYVAMNTAIVDAIIVVLNKFMHHLLSIQDIDPTTEPGEKYKKALTEALSEVIDKEDFDSDFSWSHKSFNQTKEQLDHLNLTREKFQEITDVSRLGDKAPLQVTPPQLDLEAFTMGINADKLKEALNVLQKYADNLNVHKSEDKSTSNKKVKNKVVKIKTSKVPKKSKI